MENCNEKECPKWSVEDYKKMVIEKMEEFLKEKDYVSIKEHIYHQTGILREDPPKPPIPRKN
jgi:hypothetical protein